MSAAALVSRLQGVRETGPGKWISNCPAHADKRPSLNIAELPDGRALLICRAGCATRDVLLAVGLDWSDVMPERIDTLGRESAHTGRRRYSSRERHPWNAYEVLKCLGNELRIMVVVLSDVQRGVAPTDEDLIRLNLAIDRILAADGLVNG